MLVFAAAGDEALAEEVVVALRAEGLAVELGGPDAADAPAMVFLITPGWTSDPAFEARVRRAMAEGTAVIVRVGGGAPGWTGPGADLTHWNRTDRRDAEFRALVVACRRGADAAAAAPLGLAELAALRAEARSAQVEPAPAPPPMPVMASAPPMSSPSAAGPARAAPPSRAGGRLSRPALLAGAAACAGVIGIGLMNLVGVGRPTAPPDITAASPPPAAAPEPEPTASPAATPGASPEPGSSAETTTAAAPPPAPAPESAPPPQAAAPAPPPRRPPLWPWLAGLAALGLGAAGVVWADRRRRRPRASPAPIVPAAVQPPPAPPPPPPPPPRRDLVDLSAFAPESVGPGETGLVQVFLSLEEQLEEALAAARAADPAAAARGSATLEVEIARGARVDIVLDAPGLGVDQPSQYLTWRGRARSCPFLVTAPAGASAARAPITVQAFVDGVPVGRLAFTLGVAAAEAPAPRRTVLRGETAKRYSHAFLSYCSADRLEVLKRVDAIRAAGLGFFQDILSIEPGEAWEPRLYAEIDRCDLFLLFWSSHAAASPWVVREAEYALQRRGHSPDGLPDITPIILEGPPTPLPPPSLSALHFNDVLRYVVAAAEAEQRARAPA